MRPVKVYEHPEFKAEPEDITLLSTICFVLALLSVAAIFILGVTCLVFWDDCGTSYHMYGSRPRVLTVRQLLQA
ncbi:hypothetical protein PYCCODRAFT_1467522 [Trametes coccinea BRFM310]|uniref:Uncharacterized protein n=1 Tax=Trametes coccinea (strain BRFM310) TaxID=1353009 RepID=A0A1Y2IP15_TRAC3|nr:hypothetical protein PYCCODRAFT_1467522 [Trametes coccinea BRFM310]